MIELILDENNDIVIENGDFKTVEGVEQVVQFVRTRLLFYFQEWFLDRSLGVPYFQNIFTKPADLGQVESIIKTTILETPGVSILEQFSMDFDTTNRKLTIDFLGRTNENETFSDEVITNGRLWGFANRV